MVAKSLTTELVSLINYVELNKNGWWKKATSQVILGYLWESEGRVDEKELKSKIKRDFNVDIPIENISTQIEYLLSSLEIIKRDNGYYLTEETRKKLKDKIDISSKEEKDAENSFRDIVKKNLGEVDAESYWQNFKNELISSVRRIGANTYSLLQSGRLFKTHDWLEGFLRKYSDSDHPILLRIVGEFFSNNNDLAKGYILKLLNAYFFVEASQLSQKTIESLDNTRKSKDIKIVLDTNFVFSILGLHENPADESATSLLSLAEKVGNVKVRYYILPTTLEEIRKVVSYQLDNLKRHRYSPSLARAAVQSGMRSSIAAKYFAESAKTETGLSPDAYFLPFTDGLLRNLESKGIKILEWPTVHYPTDERVVKEQLTIWEREEKKPENKRKRYEAIEHDLIFWFSIHDHRDGNADSALEENYWGVTIDWSVIQFDQLKRKKKESKLPVVLHPTNLVQLLQFWVPRDATLESGIMEAIKLPLLFGDFDVNDEKATIELIQALSTYKDIEGIDGEILSSMLADKALKQKIIDADSHNDTIIEIIESEFAMLATSYKNEITKRQSIHDNEKIALQKQIEILSARVLENEDKPTKEQILKQGEGLTNQEQLVVGHLTGDSHEKIELEPDSNILTALQSRIEELEKEKSDELNRKSERNNKIIFTLLFIFAPILIIFACFSFGYSYLTSTYNIKPTMGFIVLSIFCYVVIIISTTLSKLYIEVKSHLKKWWLVKFLSNLAAKVIIPLIVALVTFKDEIIPLIESINP
ncbi:TPA: hypothetical protein ACWLZK_000457 [Klebsiella quasipneumoniae]